MCWTYNPADMYQNRSPGPRSSQAKATAWLLMLGLWATACQAAPSVAPAALPPTAQVVPAQPAAPTIRTELAATDPTTVNLASGKPTLVEFFAFW